MTVPIVKRRLSREEYHLMGKVGILKEDDQVELINGEIIEMSPISSRHSSYVNRLNALLQNLLGDQYIISVQNPILIDDFSEPEPDLAILKWDDGFYENQHPGPKDILLLIEVALTSINYEEEVKLPMYANAGIIEFWIINVEDQVIEVYRNPDGHLYKIKEIYKTTDTINCVSLNKTLLANSILGKSKHISR